MNPPPYIGRFAPSPTGPMHFGTLVAAVASYLQAKVNNGKWIVRMEDVDTMRIVPGADKKILASLDAFGFEYDKNILYQTQQTSLYTQALNTLNQLDYVFPCTCSRKQLAKLTEYQNTGIYPGNCRSLTLPFKDEHAIRLQIKDVDIQFTDKVMGTQQAKLISQCGDFIIKRKDGLFAYQLAVVVDDALQGITEVVRGADLLDSTARQIYLQQCLNYPTPSYLHLPLALGKDGDKLSKLTAATAIDNNHPNTVLYNVLNHLGQRPDKSLKTANLKVLWTWAIEHWKISNIPKMNQAVE